jgi:hypothetical protein
VEPIWTLEEIVDGKRNGIHITDIAEEVTLDQAALDVRENFVLAHVL